MLSVAANICTAGSLGRCKAGVSNSFGGGGHTARYHSVGGPHCF